MKKIISLILALVMIMALAVSASAASITITPNVPTDGTSTGETYTAYKIFDATFEDVEGNTEIPAVSYTIAETSPFYNTIKDSGYFTLAEINESSVYNVTKNSNFTSDAAATLATSLKAVIDADTTITGTVSSGNTINVADKGYYLITSTLGSKMIVDTLGDITIETKNQYPSLTKVSDKETAAFGETVTYTVTVTVPATAAGEINVIDTMTNLTYVALTEETTTNVTGTAAGKVVTFNIPSAVVAANLGSTVKIQYTAAVDANATTASNKAYLTYSAFTSQEVTTSLSNHQIDVYKYTGSAESKTGLAGAGFVLAQVVADTSEGAEATATKTVYYNLTNGIVSWVDDIDDATEYVTAEADEFVVSFKGLADGAYTLIENTVPTGYNKADDAPVTLSGADSRIEVLNSTGSELPSTGGMGTTLFYVIGGLLMASAAVLLIAKKKMS